MRTHPLPSPGLACVMQDLKLLSFNVQWFRDLGASFSSFGCFVFEIWVLRASVFVFECFVFETTSFSRFGCSVFEFWVLRFRVLGASFSRFRGLRFRSRVLRFRVLGASFSRFGCFVFEIWVLRASVFVFECFVSETIILFMRPILLVLPRLQRGAKCWQTTKLTHRHDTCNYIGIKCERSYAGHSNVGVNLNVQCRGLGYLMSCGKHKLSPPVNPATVI